MVVAELPDIGKWSCRIGRKVFEEEGIVDESTKQDEEEYLEFVSEDEFLN